MRFAANLQESTGLVPLGISYWMKTAKNQNQMKKKLPKSM